MLCICILMNCSSPSKENNTSNKAETADNPAPSVDTINIVQMKFSPADIAVHAGDTIMWVNHDLVAHDITEEKSKAWSSSLLQPGKSWKFEATRDADYYCSIHPTMTGKIILE